MGKDKGKEERLDQLIQRQKEERVALNIEFLALYYQSISPEEAKQIYANYDRDLMELNRRHKREFDAFLIR